MNLSLALRLGRISNLPTVWTNVLVGALLAGGQLTDRRLPVLMLASSLFYIAGMFLNDAFDRDFDARFRPERPIPAGEVTARQVFVAGFGLLASGLGIVAAAAGTGAAGWRAFAAAVALAATIVVYDARHKNNPLSPLLMGSCRVLVVLTAALSFTESPPIPVYLAAAALLCHLIGLTYIAKQEHLHRIGNLWPLAFLAVPLSYGLLLAARETRVWLPLVLYVAVLAFALGRLRRRAPRDVPRAVIALIAGMSVLDAVLLAGAGRFVPALFAIAAFGLTLALQRWVAGT